MKWTETPIAGAFLAEVDRFEDERGYLDVVFSSVQLAEKGLTLPIVQSMATWNRKKHTLRGLHYQAAPRTEVKFVTCVLGAIYDVVVDLRPDSPTYKKWYGVELTAENHRALYVPEGLAHGYQTLADNSYVVYFTSQPYSPPLTRGVAWNDPAFGIRWPDAPERHVSPRDLNHPPFKA